MRELSFLDLAVLLAYLAGVVGCGLYFARRSGSTERFMAAGRSIPGWAVGLSIFGSYISSISFLANPGKSYDSDWNPFVFTLATPLAAWLAVNCFVPFYRRSGAVSAYEHFEGRFGTWARTYAVVCFLLTQMARTGTIIYLLALALSPITGWDVPAIILATGTVMTMYPFLGGIEAAVWVGVVQSVILVAGLLACLVFLFAAIPGGPWQVITVGAEHGKFGLGSFGLALDQPTVWVVFLYGLVTHLTNFGIDQSFVQRYVTARSDRDAARSVWLGGLLYVPVAAAFFFIGTGLFVLHAARPELLPTQDGRPVAPDAVFPEFIAANLPMGVTGLVIAAIFAASMDSSLNSMATLTFCDLYRRYLRPQVSEREALWVLRIATVGWGILGTAVGLAMTRERTVLDRWWELASMFSGGLLGLFLLGLLARSAGKAAALSGVIAGVCVILWISLSSASRWPQSLAALRSPIHGFLAMVAGTLAILIVGLGVTWLLGIFRRQSLPGGR